MADDDTQQEAAAQPDAPETGEKPDEGKGGKEAVLADLAKERAARKEADKTARDLQAELEKIRTANLSETERSIAEAEARGAATATSQFGQRLARSEFLAAAAKANPQHDAAAALEFVDLARFVGQDGEPDAAEIAKAVERLIPPPLGAGRPRGDVGQGPQSSAPADPGPGTARMRAAYSTTP